MLTYVRVRLLVNCWRGKIGDVVEVPAAIAVIMVAQKRAEVMDGAIRLND